MKRMNKSEIKQVEIEILKHTKQICEDNHIKYSLCGGTLIGAIRHQGYIPWDDDIDVVMPRPDYDRFIKIMLNDDTYKIMEPISCDNYFYNFAKVYDPNTFVEEKRSLIIGNIGVCIDVFPIDGMPSYKKQQVRHFKKINRYNYLMSNAVPHMYYYSDFFPKKVCKFLIKAPIACYAKLFGAKYWKHKINSSLLKYDYDSSSYAGFIISIYGMSEIMEKEIFVGYSNCIFEGELYSVFSAYDRYLRNNYGDYISMPPINKQVSHHNFDAYWKDEGDEGYN